MPLEIYGCIEGLILKQIIALHVYVKFLCLIPDAK
jgi:hypothetical protein